MSQVTGYKLLTCVFRTREIKFNVPGLKFPTAAALIFLFYLNFQKLRVNSSNKLMRRLLLDWFKKFSTIKEVKGLLTWP